jgi:hypothetical protein
MKLSALSTVATLLLSSCAMSFSNSQSHVSPEFRTVYVPSVADFGSRGGSSSRISRAVRDAIARNTRFSLTSADEARVGVAIKIVDRRQFVSKSEICTASELVVGSGAFGCPDTKNSSRPPLDEGLQPDRASERESIAFDILVGLIDLKKGKVLRTEPIAIKEGEVTYPVVAERDGTGATVRAGLANSPQLHSLRYLENTDTTVDTIGSRIAGTIVSMLDSLRTN